MKSISKNPLNKILHGTLVKKNILNIQHKQNIQKERKKVKKYLEYTKQTDKIYKRKVI